jgi:hypothetical protein
MGSASSVETFVLTETLQRRRSLQYSKVTRTARTLADAVRGSSLLVPWRQPLAQGK